MEGLRGKASCVAGGLIGDGEAKGHCCRDWQLSASRWSGARQMTGSGETAYCGFESKHKLREAEGKVVTAEEMRRGWQGWSEGARLRQR